MFAALKRLVPRTIRRWLRTGARRFTRLSQPIGGVRFGNLRRVTPFSRDFGFDRGTPTDRYYIERFLANQAEDIRGHVLEIGVNTYTHRFGGARVTKSEVLHVVEGNPQATIVGDLTKVLPIPADTFDCIICTQTLIMIYDFRAALRTLYRVLKPGGCLLLSVSGVTQQISRHDMDNWGDYWRFTSLSMRRVVEEVFPPAGVRVHAEGNVLAAMALLYGIVVEELSPQELDYRDPDYEVTILVRAEKPKV